MIISHKIGQRIAELLHLKKNKLGRYNTEWGDKTEVGLYKTLKRFIEEEEAKYVKIHNYNSK